MQLMNLFELHYHISLLHYTRVWPLDKFNLVKNLYLFYKNALDDLWNTEDNLEKAPARAFSISK